MCNLTKPLICVIAHMCVFFAAHTHTHTDVSMQRFHLKTPTRFRKLSIVLCCSPFTDGEVKVQRGYMCKAHFFLGCNNQ